jgi:hypothetical protein
MSDRNRGGRPRQNDRRVKVSVSLRQGMDLDLRAYASTTGTPASRVVDEATHERLKALLGRLPQAELDRFAAARAALAAQEPATSAETGA